MYEFVWNDPISWIDDKGNISRASQSAQTSARNQANTQNRQNNQNSARTSDTTAIATSGEGDGAGNSSVPDSGADNPIQQIADDPVNGTVAAWGSSAWDYIAGTKCQSLYESSGIKSGCACCRYTIKSWKQLIGGADDPQYYSIAGDPQMRKEEASKCVPPPPLPPGTPTTHPPSGGGQYDITYTQYAVPY